ncbi:hypothetical protein CH379_013550 [Leptospira ellisii]|uniref:Uncharacterized protein n=1 Tax=Leptospira ellisii TaxID=2023197 RepID=A0AAE4QPM7_9LEPT|nr:hypothetical protein [Leptospira ellisii]MDV6236650.1 hypothetical protein [Leptospira ellisii]
MESATHKPHGVAVTEKVLTIRLSETIDVVFGFVRFGSPITLSAA